MRKSIEFKVDGKKFKIYEPNLTIQKKAMRVRSHVLADAIRDDVMLREQLNDELKKRELWNDERENKYQKFQKNVLDGEKRLAEGGFSLEKAKELALDVKKWRGEMRELLLGRSTLDNNTAEGQADNEMFNCMVSECLVYFNVEGNEEKYFKSMEDYLESTEGVSVIAAEKLANLMYGVGKDSEKDLAENKFLTEYGFTDAKLRLINKDGHLVDNDGRLINEDGFYVSEDGEKVDVNGSLLTKDGEYKVEFKGFIDEEGQTIGLKTQEEEAPKKRGRPKKS